MPSVRSSESTWKSNATSIMKSKRQAPNEFQLFHIQKYRLKTGREQGKSSGEGNSFVGLWKGCGKKGYWLWKISWERKIRRKWAVDQNKVKTVLNETNMPIRYAEFLS